MDRRRFIAATTAGFALAALRGARAQPAGGVPRIGVLCYGSQPAVRGRVAALRKGMADLGYVEGKTVRYEWRYANGQRDLVAEFARELAALSPNILYSGSHLVTAALAQASRSIPIVAPTEEVLGDSPDKARIAPNVVGLYTNPLEHVQRSLGLLGGAIPKVARLGVLVDPGYPTYASYRARLESLGQAMRFKATFVDVDMARGVEAAFDTLGRGAHDALLVTSSTFLYNQRRPIAELAAAARIPAMYPQRGHVEAGGLMSYGEDHEQNFQRSANLVDRILKGSAPEELAMEPSPRIEFVFNRTAGRSLGVVLPPELSRRVDRFVG